MRIFIPIRRNIETCAPLAKALNQTLIGTKINIATIIATTTAKNLKADAIVVYTHLGNSARRLSGMGPQCPILAITDDEKTFYQLGLVWNVTPILVTGKASIDETLEAGIEEFKSMGILEKGDIVVISGGAKMLNTNSENQIVDGILKI